MRDLRVRFGSVLALAMLPLLVFSVWQSYYDYKRDSQARKAALVLSARQSAAEILNTLERANSVIRTVEQTFEDQIACSEYLSKISTEFEGFTDLFIAAPNGDYICATDPVAVRAQSFQYANRLSPKNPLALTKRDVLTIGTEKAATVRVAHGSFDDEKLTQIIIVDVLTNALKQNGVPLLLDAEGVQISVMNAEAEVLVGSVMQPQNIRREWIDRAQSGETVQTRFKTDERVAREIIVLRTSNPDVYIAYSQRHQSLVSWNLLNPLSSALVPIVGWVFGFLAIWLATDQLILIHLRRMRKSMVQFAAGDMAQRVGALKNPPSSIRELGRTLDIMADKISSREEELADSVVQKDMLLREIHHRVKNNLQIIISLLNMQERKLEDDEAIEAIKDTRSRINAIALVHRGLYESDDLRYIPMDVFIERLIGELAIAFGTAEMDISMFSETECMPLEADTAIPIALFIVEAITNAVKHGVDKGGRINIRIKQTGDSISVAIKDSGAGFDPENQKPGTGTKLIKGFARQLSGDLTYENRDDGHEVTMEFTHRPYCNDI